MARVTESSWFLEKGGSPDSISSLKRLCPQLPHFCSKVPALKKRHFQTKGPQPPLWAPSMTALALGINQSSPHYPHHCTRCGCGGWVGAGPSWQWSLGGPLPAESAVPAPASSAWPPHSALPPAHFPKTADGATQSPATTLESQFSANAISGLF